MYDLKMNAPAEIRGSFRPIATNVPGIEICEHMPRLAKMMDKFTIIRSLYGSPDQHNSDMCLSGYPGGPRASKMVIRRSVPFSQSSRALSIPRSRRRSA